MSQICSKMAIFLAFFVTIAMVNVKLKTRLLHLGYCCNKLIRRIWRKAIFVFWPHRVGGGGGGGEQNGPLMHVAL